MSNKLKETLIKKIDQLEENPETGKVSFKARTHLVEGVLTNASIRKFNLNVDEPLELGGNDIAPNPVELVLAALGTCQEIVYSAYAEVLGIKLNAVTVNVKGKLDLNGLFGTKDGIEAGFKKIEYETEIITDESPNKINQLIALVDSHCPVLDTLKRPVDVEGRVTVKANKAAA